MNTLLTEMAAYNDALLGAGVLLAGDGFLPSSQGARVRFSSSPDAEPSVEHGPFDVASLVSGYWILETESLEEAIGWAKKVPFRTDDAVVEVRRVSGVEDFEGVADEVRMLDEGLRKRLEESRGQGK